MFVFKKIFVIIFGCGGSSLLRELFSGCGKQGLFLIAVCRLLIAVASLVAEHGLQGTQASVIVARGLSSCSSWAPEHRLDSCSTWACVPQHLPRPGIKPMFSALADRFLTIEPPGKPCLVF